MDNYDKSLIDFQQRWAPFGGPKPADIFVEFGITEFTFKRRLEALTAPTSGQAFHAPDTGSRKHGVGHR